MNHCLRRFRYFERFRCTLADFILCQQSKYHMINPCRVLINHWCEELSSLNSLFIVRDSDVAHSVAYQIFGVKLIKLLPQSKQF